MKTYRFKFIRVMHMQQSTPMSWAKQSRGIFWHKPDAEIYFGHHAQTRAEFSQMVEQRDWDRLLRKVPVKAGDFSMYQQVLCMPWALA